ncbi:MAG: tetratricopeptide repeat protein, partial [Candidatus Krumholzibacteria bacterium]|nr:tetratricopeptide repeat protein [Candidatus Krumholzibacteria bacterium]
WRLLVLVAVVSFAANLLYLAQSRNDPTFDRPVLDAQTYDQEARAIAAGQPAAHEPFWQPPLYSYWLSLIYAATDGSIPAAKLLEALAGVVTCVLTTLVARRLLDEAVAIIAGLIAALSGPLVFYNVQLLPAGLATLLDLVAFFLLLRAVQKPTLAGWFWCGLATGLAALAVGNALVLAVLAAIWLLCGAVRPRRWAALGVLLLGIVVGIAPATIRNYVVAREFVPISTNAGVNLYVGNNPDAWRTMAIRPGFEWADLTRMPTRNGASSPSAANVWFVKQVVRYAAADPAGFLRGLLVKTRLFVNAREIPRNTDIYVHASYAPWLRALTWRVGSFAFPFGVVAPLALLGLLMGCRRGTSGRWLAAGFLVLYGASIILFFVASRYRVVLTPFFAIFAAAGLAWLWERRNSSAALWAGLAVVAVAGIAANLPVRTPTDAVNFAAELRLFLGARAAMRGEVAEAEAEYAEALRIEPAYADVWLGLGNLRRQQGDLDRAIYAYSQAASFAPQYAEAHNNLASVLLDRGLVREAIDESRAAIRLRPASPSPYHNLGMALLRTGEGSAAAEAFRQCIRLDSTKVEARGQLAWVLATHPDDTVRSGEEAVRSAEGACRSMPDPSPMMLDVLGAAYAEAGRFDEAIGAANLAVSKAMENGQADLATRAREHIRAYQARKPCRDTSLTAARRAARHSPE